MVLPPSYFIQTPFKNWTREVNGPDRHGNALRRPYGPDRRPAQLEDTKKASKLWDGKVVNLATTDITAQVLEVRCLMCG